MAQKKKKSKKRSEFSQLPKKNKAAPLIDAKVATAAPLTPAVLPSDMEPSLGNVQKLFEDGLRNDAMIMLNKLPDSTVQDIPLLEELGHKMMSSGEFDNAAVIHRRWTEVDPDNPRAFNALGTALVSAKWLEPAHMALQQAVMLSPDNLIYKFNLAKLYMVRSHWGEARAMLIAMLNKYPEQKSKIDDLLAQFPAGE